MPNDNANRLQVPYIPSARYSDCTTLYVSIYSLRQSSFVFVYSRSRISALTLWVDVKKFLRSKFMKNRLGVGKAD